MVHDQMNYQIKNHFSNNDKSKKANDRKVFVTVSFDEQMNGVRCFMEDYEFWSQDQYYLFSDILDQRIMIA